MTVTIFQIIPYIYISQWQNGTCSGCCIRERGRGWLDWTNEFLLARSLLIYYIYIKILGVCVFDFGTATVRINVLHAETNTYTCIQLSQRSHRI